MRVGDVMSREVRMATPDQRISEAAKLMAQSDIGLLPVCEDDRLVGMITDRDIAVRAVAAGKRPDATVREVMTSEVKYCYEDEDLLHVSRNMADLQLRRLPVVNRDKRLVGILTLADIAAGHGARTGGHVMIGITRPGGPHTS